MYHLPVLLASTAYTLFFVRARGIRPAINSHGLPPDHSTPTCDACDIARHQSCVNSQCTSTAR